MLGRARVAFLAMDQCRRAGRREESPPPAFPAPAEERLMNTNHNDDATAAVPWVQQLLDNPFLLLFLGVFVPMVLYTVWGVYDILTLPLAK
jgi:hypothetical protein